MTIRTLFLSALALAGVAAAGPALSQTAEARGAALVKQDCAGCHSLGPGASPNPNAPPMPEIARKYRAEDLEEAFAEGIMVSHQATDMPPFTYDPPQIAALTAYLKALRAARP